MLSNDEKLIQFMSTTGADIPVATKYLTVLFSLIIFYLESTNGN